MGSRISVRFPARKPIRPTHGSSNRSKSLKHRVRESADPRPREGLVQPYRSSQKHSARSQRRRRAPMRVFTEGRGPAPLVRSRNARALPDAVPAAAADLGTALIRTKRSNVTSPAKQMRSPGQRQSRTRNQAIASSARRRSLIGQHRVHCPARRRESDPSDVLRHGPRRILLRRVGYCSHFSTDWRAISSPAAWGTRSGVRDSDTDCRDS